MLGCQPITPLASPFTTKNVKVKKKMYVKVKKINNIGFIVKTRTMFVMICLLLF